MEKVASDDKARERVEREVELNIEKYNAQVNKLAKIGASIIAYDDTMQQKFVLGEGASAKPIRVPGPLMGILRSLTSAGRRQKKLEEAIEDHIAEVAEQAIGQDVNDSLDAKAINELGDITAVAKDVKVATGVIAPPSKDVSEEAKADDSKKEENGKEEVKKVEPEKKEPSKEEKNKAKAVVDAVVSDAAKKKVSSSDLNGKYSERVAAEKAVETGDLFAVLREFDAKYGVGERQIDGKKVELLYTKSNNKFIGYSFFGTDKDARKQAYSDALKCTKLADTWNKACAKANVTNPFADENKKAFDYLKNAVGLEIAGDKNAIVEAAKKDLTAEEAKLVETYLNMDSKMSLFKAAIPVITEEKQVENKKDGGEAEVSKKENPASKQDVVDKEVSKLAMTKYGKKVAKDDVATNEEDVNKDLENSKDADKNHDNDKDVSKSQDDNSLASQISKLVNDISAMVDSRNELEGKLGDKARDLIGNFDRLIAEKQGELDNLINANIVGLGNKAEENVVTNNNTNADNNVNANDNANTNNDVENRVEPNVSEPVVDPHADDISWWVNMASILDSPDNELLSRVNIARAERERAAIRAQDEIDRRHFNERRAELIAADRERRRERFEANSVERARGILSHLSVNGERVYSDEDLNDIEDLVGELAAIRENAPNSYADAEQAYWNEVRSRNVTAIRQNAERVNTERENAERETPEREIPERETAERETPVVNNSDNNTGYTIPSLVDETPVVTAGSTPPPGGPGSPSNGEDEVVVANGNEAPAPSDAVDKVKVEPVDAVGDASLVKAETPKENIEYIMDVINDVYNITRDGSIYADTEGVLERSYFNEHPRLYDEMQGNYEVPAGPEFWNLVAQGYNPVTSTNVVAEGVRHDRRADAARDFLDFTFSLDEETLDAMANGGQERTPLEVVNSLPREQIFDNLESYSRYVAARKERFENEKEESQGRTR